MEEFSRLRGITKHQLRKVNKVRLYLRVITIADLANEAGNYIRDDMLTGEWTAGTDLEFPKQNRPPPEWFALFRSWVDPNKKRRVFPDGDLPVQLRRSQSNPRLRYFQTIACFQNLRFLLAFGFLGTGPCLLGHGKRALKRKK